MYYIHRTFSMTILLGILLFLCVSPAVSQEKFDPAAGMGFIHPSGGANRAPSMAAQAPQDVSTFHYGPTLNCAHCHIMHASKQHEEDDPAQPDPWGSYPQTYTPTKSLLKATDPVALCLKCHDNFPGVPDVVGADVNGLQERSAGYFEQPDMENYKGHKIAYGIQVAPEDWELCYRCHWVGEMASAAVSCIDCHNPHGNGRARNLQWASWPGGEPALGLFTNPGVTGMAKYEAANIGYGSSDNNLNREVTTICIDCHHVFTGEYTDPDGNGIHNRHPSYDSERGTPNNIAQGAADGHSAPQHWNDGIDAGFQADRVPFVTYGATDFASSHVIDATKNGVFCLSCHKAHGGNRAYALNWNPTSGIAGEGCDQCHDKTGL